ncbi:MAG: cysteine desulfurase family protein [Methylacidiphilales bacterium]|nr:cysteine desulfurase family protein [Candidatus Methylacidiphilales bacterium]
MPAQRLYLDHLATTPLAAEAREAMLPFLADECGLPSSLHREGLRAKEAVEQARASFASLLGASDTESIIFTSSGTEAGNLAIKGLAQARAAQGRHLVLSEAEHPAVMESVAFLERQGWTVTRVPVDSKGFINPEQIASAIRPDTVLVAAHLSNHDSGAVQPVAKIARIARERGVAVFCDATTGGGWLSADVGQLGVDLLSLSPHRFFGPKGAGVLYRRSGLELAPLIHGGRQEHGLRAGPLNVAAIAGAGVAAILAKEHMQDRAAKCRELILQLWEGLTNEIQHIKLNGPEPGPDRDPRHLNVSFEFIEGEALMLLLDLNGVSVTAATGCVSKNMKISPVLKAMGVEIDLALGAILFSPGPDQTGDDIRSVVAKTAKAVARLRDMSPGKRGQSIF